MQSSKEQQGERKRSPLTNNAKHQRKTTEWERLEISSRKLEIPTFHARMDPIKNTNGKDLREAEDIKMRWQEYIEKLYKKRS